MTLTCRTLGVDDGQDRLRELGQLLRRLRKDAWLTDKELAQRAGVAQPTISRIETGGLLPTPVTVERGYAALGLDEEARRLRGCVMRVPAWLGLPAGRRRTRRGFARRGVWRCSPRR
ncbi:helix-turn-helix domain-containing protein [Thermobispora bispora]|uniref:helix-turn-helix domain-containing protein n=1 Tax=Thermobispora bispora TaxID=2006 RepID=UPI00334022B5